MLQELQRRFERTNRLFVDVISETDAQDLASRLGSEPSNTLGEQLWCVLGARESYTRAALAGGWQGFSCPLSPDRTTDASEILRLLDETHAGLQNLLAASGDLLEERLTILLDLLEHESQHHGQLIRYLYALQIPRPESWKERYALD